MKAGNRTAAWLIAGLLIVYLVLAALLPAADDEVYYWAWARPLQFSYYDHPPLTAYLIRLSIDLFGNSIFGFRVPACLATVFVVAVIAHLSRPKSLLPGILFSPLFTVGAVMITPDTPLLCAWAAYVWWLVEVHRRLTPVPEEGSESTNAAVPWWLWLVGGAILGCGVLGKYTMALAVPSGFASFCIVRHLWRRWLPGYILHGVVAFVVASPILIHNIQHNFVPLLFQWRHSMGDSRPGLRPFGDFIGVQLLLFGTLPFFLYPWVLWNFRRLCENPRLRACVCLYALPMTFFLYKATRAPLQGNWALVMFVSFWPLAAVWYQSVRQSKFWRWSTASAFIIPAVCVIALLIHVIVPLPFVPIEGDRVTKQYALNDAIHRIAETIHEQGEQLPVYTPTYQITAWLRFQSLDCRQIDQISRPSHFTQHPERLTDVTRAYVVADYPLPAEFAKGFDEPELIGTFPVIVRGESVRDFKLYRYSKSVAAKRARQNVALVSHEESASEPARLDKEQTEPGPNLATTDSEWQLRVRIFEVTREGLDDLGFHEGFFQLPARDYHSKLEDLEKSRKLTTKSQPVMVLKKNQLSRFFDGDKFAVPVPGPAGDAIVEWREFGTEIKVTPTSLEDGRLTLVLEISVSEKDMANAITLNGALIPGISRRRIRSTVTAAFDEAFLAVLFGPSVDGNRLFLGYGFELEAADAPINAREAGSTTNDASQSK